MGVWGTDPCDQCTEDEDALMVRSRSWRLLLLAPEPARHETLELALEGGREDCLRLVRLVLDPATGCSWRLLLALLLLAPEPARDATVELALEPARDATIELALEGGREDCLRPVRLVWDPGCGSPKETMLLRAMPVGKEAW